MTNQQQPPSYGATPTATLNPRPPPSYSIRPFRLVFLLALLSLLSLTICIFPTQRTSPVVHTPLTIHAPITVAILGDWGRKGKYGQIPVADSLSATVAQINHTKAIISTGDNFYKVGVDHPYDKHFNKSFERVYSHQPLQELPWYAVLGNHDHLGSIQVQIDYTHRSTRWQMPSSYYSRQLSPNLIAIFLDTTPFVAGTYGATARKINLQNPGSQLKWLESTLSSAEPNMYFLIIGHHNMYTMNTEDHLGTPELVDNLEPLLNPYGGRVLAYVSGHEHALMHMQPVPRANGYVLDHFLSGAGSKINAIVEPPVEEIEKWRACCGVLPVSDDPSEARTVWGGSYNGFLTFHFDGSIFTARAIGTNQTVLYEYSKTV